ncbi:MAG: hypothetical protein L6Q37_03655 [Bdellovibrionaceae bacterium]|nr:hypothetical protein [Pseudobdellovibrionaceae bacterium]NUM58157.1 hypothetical protein [Pseudobdellovibrionaceae bacterium]
MKKIFLTIKLTYSILAFILALALTSCMGQSSDPRGKYAELSAIPVDQAKDSESQFAAPEVFTSISALDKTELLSLKVDGTNEINQPHFLEAVESRFYFKIFPKSQKISDFKVEILDISSPLGLVSEKARIENSSRPGMFSIRWKAPKGLIPAGELYQIATMRLQTTVTAASDNNLKGLAKIDVINIIITRDNSVPIIVGKSKLGPNVDEGTIVKFTVDIEDKASLVNEKFPEALITPYKSSNPEAFRADGSSFVRLDASKNLNPERLNSQKGLWRFYFEMDLNQLPYDRTNKGKEDTNSNSVGVCFYMRFISSITTLSEQQQVCVQAQFQAKSPEVEIIENPLAEFIAQETGKIKFKISSENPFGEVDFKDPQKQVNSLFGSKEVSCYNEDKANTEKDLAIKICEISFKPSCVKKDQDKKITLKFENKMGFKVKSKDLEVNFKIKENPSLCTTSEKLKTTPQKVTKQ